MKRKEYIDKPTQRLVPIHVAAAYCGVSVSTFERECNVTPIVFGGTRKSFRIDLREVDSWIESHKAGSVHVDWADMLGQ